MSQHSEYAENLAAYALGALPDAEAEELRRHLETCPECRGELERLRPAVDALPASVEQFEPPPELKGRLMSVVESEAERLPSAGAAANRVPGMPRRPLRLPRWRPALGLAISAAVAAAIVLLVTIGGSGARTIEAQVSPQLRTAGAHASLRVNGKRAVLVVTGLPTPAAGHVDELWVKHGEAAPTPAGTFLIRTGSVQVPQRVRGGDQVLVTVEPGRGTSAPTTAPLLVARV